MEARLTCVAFVFAAILSTGAGYRTENFIVTCPDPDFGAKVAEEAERFRKELAIEWLGHELPPWEQKCPIEVVFAKYASGRTSFGFASMGGPKGYPVSWEMVVEGPADRILDAVLPHEITHAIFATHFGQKLPRWADEGACTTVEHESERAKHRIMLVEFLTTKRGIPFNRMFPMMEYPRDMLPLYAQGHSVAQFLINHRGKREFVKFIADGLRHHHDWDRVVQEYYGYDDLSDLQLTWNDWVRKGSKEWTPNTVPTSDVAMNPQERSATPERTFEGGNDTEQLLSESLLAEQSSGSNQMQGSRPTRSAQDRLGDANGGAVSSESWYFAVMREHQQGPPSQPQASSMEPQGSVTYRRQIEAQDRAVIESVNPRGPTVWR